jgi:hypothetical protein
MRERLGKFALSLHPEKTRLIEFGRLAAESRERRGLGKRCDTVVAVRANQKLDSWNFAAKLTKLACGN